MKASIAKKRSGMRRERGTVLVAALVALLIVTSLLGTMLIVAIRGRRQLHAERNLRQCELLLRAGLDRVATRLSRDDTYLGETWHVASDALAGREGRVVIAVKKTAAAHQKQLEITAEYPLGDEWSVRRSFTGTLKGRTFTREEN